MSKIALFIALTVLSSVSACATVGQGRGRNEYREVVVKPGEAAHFQATRTTDEGLAYTYSIKARYLADVPAGLPMIRVIVNSESSSDASGLIVRHNHVFHMVVGMHEKVSIGISKDEGRISVMQVRNVPVVLAHALDLFWTHPEKDGSITLMLDVPSSWKAAGGIRETGN